MFKNSYIFIDEFAGFTKQEYGIVEELFNEFAELNNLTSTTIYPNQHLLIPKKEVIITAEDSLTLDIEDREEFIAELGIDKVSRKVIDWFCSLWAQVFRVVQIS